jgi:hypothetical protein
MWRGRVVRPSHRRSRGSWAAARILSQPEAGENGTRYRGEDLEGHRWMFIER